jgi:hypothetical protein
LSAVRFHSVTFGIAMIIVAAAPLRADDAPASDRVWVQQQRPTSTQSDWYPRAIQTLAGKVVGLDATQLRFVVTGDEAETVIASDRVIWVEPAGVDNLQAEMLQLFVDDRHNESLSKLPSVLQQRPPVWRQQWLTMLAASSAWKSGHSKIALDLVSQLDRRPLPALSLAWLPVAWTNGRQNADAVSAAKTRLSDPSPAVQLVAASWLLSSPARSQATAVLNGLKGHDRTTIAALAEVLLWRTATPPQVIESSRTWQTQIDALPIVLQTGPTKTLIDKLRAAGQSDQAQRLEWSLELVPIHRMSYFAPSK